MIVQSSDEGRTEQSVADSFIGSRAALVYAPLFSWEMRRGPELLFL